MKKIDPAELKLHIPCETFYREALGEPIAKTAMSRIYFCPFHNDRKTPNFTVFNDGGYKCFSCNESGDVIAFYMKRQKVDFPTALDELAQKYAPAMLNRNGGKPSPKAVIIEEYNYRDAASEVVFQVVRFEPKDFRQRRPDGNGGWVWNLQGVELVPYQLPGILSSTGTVYITEGEKDAYRLVECDLIATTCAGGAGKWKPEFNQYLRDRDVVILQDNDEPGRKHGEKIANSLHGIARTLKVISFDELPLHGDVSDFLETHTIENLLARIEETPTYCPPVIDVATLPVGETQTAVSELWEDPETIETKLIPVRPLLQDMIPEPFQVWAADVSYRMQCPLDFIGAAAVVMVGAVIGAGCGIRPKRRDDWLVIPNLWGGVVARPGMLKTPALDEAMRPIDRLEIQAREEFEKCEGAHLAEVEAVKASREALRAGMVKAAKDNKNMDGLKSDFANLPEPEKPTWKRYRTNDPTIEKLGELLEENPRGILYFRDELTGLLTSWDKPGRESDRAFFLESWNGKGSHTSDRIGRGSILIKNCCVSIFGGIQPGKLEGYLWQSTNSLENDGLLQRFQVLVYPDEVENWELIDQYPDKREKNRVFQIVERISTMNFTLYGADVDEGGIPYFRFSDDAQALFKDWLTDLQTVKLIASESPIMQEHLAKYRKLMPALALIFHLIDIAGGAAGGAVSLGAAQRAAAWCDYLESHARRIYGMAGDGVQQAAAKLVDRIKTGELPGGFTVRDIYRKGWHGLTDKETVRGACSDLVEAKWLREVTTPAAFGQKPKTTYFINPKTKGDL